MPFLLFVFIFLFANFFSFYLDFFLGGENLSTLLALELGDRGPANLDTGVLDLTRLPFKFDLVKRDPVPTELRGEFTLEDDEDDAEYEPPVLTSALTKALDITFLNLSPADALRGDAIKLRVALRISSVILIRMSG